MVVDDEKIIRDTFVAAFDEYRIIPVASGQEALNILNRPNDIDLIILDMMMPGLTGTELLREIKRINPNYKVIVLTGYSSKDVVIEASRVGADEFIEKPFDIKQTLKIIKRLLDRKNNSSK